MNTRDLIARTAWGAAAGVIATIAYRSIQSSFIGQAVVRDSCWGWQWLPFNASWIWPYLSMFVLVGLPWFFLPKLSQVRWFATCLLATAAVGWISFILFPTACARPPAEGQPAYYALLLTLDKPNNCLPCLHSAFSVLAAWALARGCHVFRNWAGALFLGSWLLVICISIVGLRQHTDWDTVAGCVLGGVAAWLFQSRLSVEPGLPRE